MVYNLSPLPQQRGVLVLMQMLLAVIDYAVLFLHYYKSVELKLEDDPVKSLGISCVASPRPRNMHLPKANNLCGIQF